MSLACVYTRARCGLEAPVVVVEVHLAGGLPALGIVGLPETAVRESRDRVRAAISNSGFKFPARRITVNLAPADLPKEGGGFDLPIAIGILAASGQLPTARLKDCEFLGELALGGALRPVRGILNAAVACRDTARRLVAPQGDADQIGLVPGLRALVAPDLLAVCRWLAGAGELPGPGPAKDMPCAASHPDLRDVRGQHNARRALEIAACGGHHLLFAGPPGTGKSMLASRLPGILPALGHAEALEVAAVASAGRTGFRRDYWRQRPFRAPHHSASTAALVGGGSFPAPGEISMAHRGVLFLDELPEFDRRVLEALREPLESGQITISRAAGRARFPAVFQLVGAMNPCPCGYFGDARRECRCSPALIQRYQSRVSGPLMDRIDMRVPVPRLPADDLADTHPGESSHSVRERVIRTRRRQLERGGKLNARLDAGETENTCRLPSDDRRFLVRAITQLEESPRSFHHVLRLARTVADMSGRDGIERKDLLEALSFRRLA